LARVLKPDPARSREAQRSRTLRARLPYNTDTTSAHLSSARSLLFVPGSDERKLRRALASTADGVIVDLEDAVLPELKESARLLTVRLVQETEARPLRIVRINGTETPWWEDDLEAVGELDLDAIMLPKSTPEAVEALGSSGPPLIPLIETGQGLRLAFEIAAEPRVIALALGGADLAVALRLTPRPDGQELLYARSKVVADSAAAGIRAPFDVVHFDVRDHASLEAVAAFARSLGFGGKLCVHPDQVTIVNRVFAPTEAEVAWARAVIEAHETGAKEGRGAVALHGMLVDRPVVERARQIIAGVRKERG
jgi:citrate lyase beta subunit